MLRVVRSFYQVGYTNIPGAAAAIGSTLQNGDQLYFQTTSVLYATVVGNSLVYATN
jgi:hypothetical protein